MQIERSFGGIWVILEQLLHENSPLLEWGRELFASVMTKATSAGGGRSAFGATETEAIGIWLHITEVAAGVCGRVGIIASAAESRHGAHFKEDFSTHGNSSLAGLGGFLENRSTNR